MKKLLALCIVGGLLCTMTGCPSPSTGTTGPKKEAPDKDMKGRPGKRFDKKTEETTPGGGTKKEEKKEEVKPDGGTKKEEKKEEVKPDGGAKKDK